jgi:glycosyltransferase A (GT-A) superfamily protein (DUF2064 family)
MSLNKTNTTSTAILLFAFSKNAESIFKPIACNKVQNVLLWKKINERVLKTIQKTNLPYFISDETSQSGVTFGEKLSFAIQKVIDIGFKNVIVIGNDCMELQTNHLLEASNKLKTNDVVLGPNFNGGTYLIGVSKSSFDVQNFINISWQTSKVFSELKDLYINNYTAVLSSLNDCNSTSDLKKVIQQLSFSDNFKYFLLSILRKVLIGNTYKKVFITYSFNNLYFNKGSPLYL